MLRIIADIDDDAFSKQLSDEYHEQIVNALPKIIHALYLF